MRRLAVCLFLLLPLTGVACSDDDGGGDDAATDDTEESSSPAPGGEGDVEAYCDAVRRGAELVEEYGDSEDPPQEVQAEFLELWSSTVDNAPSEIRSAYAASMTSNGTDAEAQQEIDDFNQRECDVDTSALSLEG